MNEEFRVKGGGQKRQQHNTKICNKKREEKKTTIKISLKKIHGAFELYLAEEKHVKNLCFFFFNF